MLIGTEPLTLKSITYPERFFSLFNWPTLKINLLWHYPKIILVFLVIEKKNAADTFIKNKINLLNASSIPTTFHTQRK